MELLDRIEPLATEEEVQQRRNILKELQHIVNRWVVDVSKEQNQPEELLKTACGRILTFGSFRLGLVTPSSDIDALCVTPKYVPNLPRS
jgi:poly(A) polymerase